MKNIKKIIVMMLILAISLATSITSSATINIIEEKAEVLYKLGIFDGKDEREFIPALEIETTRQEAIKLIVEAFQWVSDDQVKSEFDDVADWAQPYVAVAAAKGITNGNGNGLFGGEYKVSTRELNTWIDRSLGIENAWEVNEKASTTDRLLRGDLVVAIYEALTEIPVGGKDSLIKSIVGSDSNLIDFAISVGLLEEMRLIPNITVQSPEQYLIEWKMEVTDLVASDMIIERYDTEAKAWVAFAQVVDEAIDNQEMDFVLTTLDDGQFLLEADCDWTVHYNTLATTTNYYDHPYRIKIFEGSVTYIVNGEGNQEIVLPLGEGMIWPDTTSPFIEAIEVNKKNVTNYDVTMSEPIKSSLIHNQELLTASQEQVALIGVPTPTYEFINMESLDTILGTKVGFVDHFDQVIEVMPTKPLTPGVWTLVIRTISDDVGNVSMLTDLLFSVEPTVSNQNDFDIAWCFTSSEHELAAGNIDVDKTDIDYDYIFVKFTKGINTVGEFKNALKTSNYTLGGSLLPIGTRITPDIKGYDDYDAVFDSVTICLPNGTLGGVNGPTTINISPYIQSFDGEALGVAGGEKSLTYYNNKLFMGSETESIEESMAALLISKELAVVELIKHVEVRLSAVLLAEYPTEVDNIDDRLIRDFIRAYEHAKENLELLDSTSLVKKQYDDYIDNALKSVKNIVNQNNPSPNISGINGL